VVIADLVLPALYDVEVTHTRRSPLRHAFRHRSSYWLVDFDQLPQPKGMARWCARLRREDHMDVRHLLAERGIDATRVVMLSGARTLGYTFNPISLFWCYDEIGASCAVVAEVHNTYGGRHAYVLAPGVDGESTVQKEMYVSPFNPVEGSYRIRAGEPTSSVRVSVTLERPGEEPFVATLHGTRHPITFRSVVRSAFRHSGVRTRFLIQWQALGLWRRGLKVQPR
jgi:uncharacterized protein